MNGTPYGKETMVDCSNTHILGCYPVQNSFDYLEMCSLTEIAGRNLLITSIIYSTHKRLHDTLKTEKNPTEYLKTLFEQLPHAESDEQLKQLLPHNLQDNTLN